MKMAWVSQHVSRIRSSFGQLNSRVTLRAISSQAAKGNGSFLRSTVAPIVLGATVATSGIFAAKKLYDLKREPFCLIKNVHAATVEKKEPNTKEKTFIMVKPDGVQRGLVGEIIKRFEQRGFRLVAMKFMQPKEGLLNKHYADLRNLPFFPGLIKHMSSGPVVAMVWEGLGAVKTGRAMLGETDPGTLLGTRGFLVLRGHRELWVRRTWKAKSKPGTIRGDFCIQIGRNIIHGSDSVETAINEINLWFKEEELINWKPAQHANVYE